MQIAWLDDDEDFRALVASQVVRWSSHTVDVVADADDPAMDQADLWVVDLAMADVDGLTLVERAVERSTPVVVVSSLMSPHMRRLVRGLGASAFWEKSDLVANFPDDPADLLAHR